MAEDVDLPKPVQQESPLSRKYKPLLWQRAGKLQSLRNSLQDHQMKLYGQIEEMQNRHLNLYEQEQMGKKELEYWRIQEKMEDITNMEDEIVQAIESLEDGTASEEGLQEIAPPPVKETEELSKKKKRMQEEEERLGISQAEIDWDLDVAFGPNPTRLTTGRNRKRLKGSYNLDVAADEFFYQTTDTHGGKVKHGKRGGSYVGSGGRRVRKS
jgi:hypothetical protein